MTLNNNRARHAVRAAVLSALAVFAAPISSAHAEKIQLDVAAGEAPDALKEFIRQTGLQLIFDFDSIAAFKTHAVSGQYDAAEALTRMLSNTGLAFEFVNERTVTVTRKEAITQRPKVIPTKVSYERDVSATSEVERVRVAQAVEAAASSHETTALNSASKEDLSERRIQLEEVIVTGSHIRGVRAIGAPILEISREDIQRTGYATAQEALLTVPQNLGSLSEHNSGPANLTYGIGADLRGLGPGATLTLVNGRRQPTAGDGSFVDLSSIPATAIERIEILTDGASAIYGSDAIGGVVNIILRKDYEGAETQLRFAGAGSFDEAEETVLSQTFSHAWNSANVLIGYQYLNREPLAAADRALTRSADKRRFGGTDRRDYAANPGNITLLDGTMYGIPTGQDGRSLDVDDLLPAGQANRGEPLAGSDVLAGNRTHSAFFSASWRPHDRLEVFSDGRYGQRQLRLNNNAAKVSLLVPDTHPFNPFDTMVFVDYDLAQDFANILSAEVTTWAGAAGARFDAGNDWSVTATINRGEERSRSVAALVDYVGLFDALFDPDPATVFNPFGDGAHTAPQTIAALRTQDVRNSDMTVQTYSVLAQGRLFDWHAGTAKLALGAEYRKEALDSPMVSVGSQNPGLERNVVAGFAELVAPLWARDRETLLEASLAGRYEEYSDFGSSFNPRIGLQLYPVSALSIHASWSTSFRAPRLAELDEMPQNYLRTFSDVQGGTLTAVTLGLGSQANANLKEETATSWNFGFKFAPVVGLSGLEVALNYYGIEYDDRILTPFTYVFFDPLAFPEWSDIVHLSPSTEQLAAACRDLAGGNGAAQCTVAQPTAIVDYRYRNVSATRTRGLDLKWSQTFSLPFGEFAFNMNGNYLLEYEQLASPNAQTTSLVDTFAQPLRLRVRSGVSFSRGPWRSDLAVNYAGAYRNPTSTMSPHVGSWATVDAGIAYRMGNGGGLLRDTQFAVRAANLFDEEPPFADSMLGYDHVNGRVLGRFVSVTLQKTW